MLRWIAAALIVFVAASLVAACRWPMPTGRATGRETAQGYPPSGPPPPPPAATPTPGADADGYLPPPTDSPGQTVRLTDGPYADMLVGLQSAIDGGRGAWFTDHVGGRSGLALFDVAAYESEGGTVLDAGQAGALASAFFATGARPRVQAYLEEARATTVCLYVLTHRWQGTVPYPGIVDLGGAEPIGQQPPATVPLDAAAFHLCRDQRGSWTLDEWIHGGYYETIARLHASHAEWPLYIVRP